MKDLVDRWYEGRRQAVPIVRGGQGESTRTSGVGIIVVLNGGVNEERVHHIILLLCC